MMATQSGTSKNDYIFFRAYKAKAELFVRPSLVPGLLA